MRALTLSKGSSSPMPAFASACSTTCVSSDSELFASRARGGGRFSILRRGARLLREERELDALREVCEPFCNTKKRD